VLSRNKIKYLSSLKIKKFRNAHQQFVVEGDKIIQELVQNKSHVIRHLIGTPAWFAGNSVMPSPFIQEISETNAADIKRISSLETPPEVLALLDIAQPILDRGEVLSSISIALDTIQDPGNLGTILRTADWFGIRNVFCNDACADCFNPKVVQASMGALFNVKVHYVSLPEFLAELTSQPGFGIYGTFMDGQPLNACKPEQPCIVVFGNESRGISGSVASCIRHRITIPPGGSIHRHVESLNVSAAVAVVCSVFAGN
jgi:RNA methyltransferase, TrmH family